jgi:hypothetical protein
VDTEAGTIDMLVISGPGPVYNYAQSTGWVATTQAAVPAVIEWGGVPDYLRGLFAGFFSSITSSVNTAVRSVVDQVNALTLSLDDVRGEIAKWLTAATAGVLGYIDAVVEAVWQGFQQVIATVQSTWDGVSAIVGGMISAAITEINRLYDEAVQYIIHDLPIAVTALGRDVNQALTHILGIAGSVTNLEASIATLQASIKPFTGETLIDVLLSGLEAAWRG